MSDLRTAAATEGAQSALRRILAGRTGQRITVDQIRPELEAAGVHGNAIGAAVHNAYQAGILMPTEDMRVSTAPNARGRRVVVWRVQYVRAAA